MSNALTFQPSIYELTLNSEESVNLTGAVTNNTNKDITFKIYNKNVNIDSVANGKFDVVDYAQFTPADWIKLNQTEITVGAAQTKDFSFTVTLPRSAEIRDYYPLLVLENYDSSNASNVGVNFNIAVPVLVNVADQLQSTRDFIKIGNFESANSLVTDLNLNLSFSINNLSKNFIKPTGIIKIYNSENELLGNLPRVNNNFKTMLPGQSLSENIVWNGADNSFSLIPKFGNYKAVLEVYTSAGNNPVVMESTFFVLPIYHILGLITLLALAAVLAFRFKRKSARS